MSNQLIRLIKLIQKTGDKLVIYDPTETIEPYVIMGLGDYEVLLANNSEIPLTDGDLSDKISFVNDSSLSEEDFVENKPNFESPETIETEPILSNTEIADFLPISDNQIETVEEEVIIEEKPEIILPWHEDSVEEKVEPEIEKEVIQGNDEMIEKAGLKSLGSVIETRLEELQKRMSQPLSRFNDK